MPNPPHSYRLLIVDDDAVDRRLYTKLLTRREHDACEITQAADAVSGLDRLRTQEFDCVLLDFNLPDMTGLDFLTNAATNGDLPCAVVVITGQGNEAIAVEAMKSGAQDYLVKDQVNADSLWRAILQAVNQTELRHHLAGSLRDLTVANRALEKEAASRKAVEFELRAAKQAAEQANHAKTRFVAMVTHELRTPLNGILGYAQLLNIEGGLSARQDTHVNAILRAGEHLLEMVERVLDFASIESARMELHPVTVSVHDLTEQCIAFIGPMATEHALSLHVVRAHDAPKQIVTDPARLRQVLLNLLGNAVKYTDAGSVELRVLAGATPGGVRIEVADTGHGINEDGRSRLFQDFERLNAATSVEGTGLGLAITARIVKLMGGTINHMPNPAGGSVFWLELPTMQLPSSSQPDPVPARVASPPPSRRLLLVDDIAMNRDVIGALLSVAGHSVVVAESGQDAIRIATEQAFDLILMDVRMPEMDGLEATRRIRALPGPVSQVPIVALTANTFPDQVMRCRKAGMSGHIGKPVTYTTLIPAIEDAIGGGSPCFTGDLQILSGSDAGAKEPPPRFDRAVLDKTLKFLSVDSIDTSLQSLRVLKKTMLQLLDQHAGLPQQTDAAHALASAAGMFGFAALCTVSRSFEYAVAQNAPDAASLATELRVETCAALTELDALIRARRLQVAAV